MQTVQALGPVCVFLSPLALCITLSSLILLCHTDLLAESLTRQTWCPPESFTACSVTSSASPCKHHLIREDFSDYFMYEVDPLFYPLPLFLASLFSFSLLYLLICILFSLSPLEWVFHEAGRVLCSLLRSQRFNRPGVWSGLSKSPLTLCERVWDGWCSAGWLYLQPEMASSGSLPNPAESCPGPRAVAFRLFL